MFKKKCRAWDTPLGACGHVVAMTRAHCGNTERKPQNRNTLDKVFYFLSIFITYNARRPTKHGGTYILQIMLNYCFYIVNKYDAIFIKLFDRCDDLSI